jgi:hypothetical protein
MPAAFSISGLAFNALSTRKQEGRNEHGWASTLNMRDQHPSNTLTTSLLPCYYFVTSSLLHRYYQVIVPVLVSSLAIHCVPPNLTLTSLKAKSRAEVLPGIAVVSEVR